MFPAIFPAASKGMMHDLNTFGLRADVARSLGYLRGSVTLHSFDDKLKSLAVGDFIRLPTNDEGARDKHAEVTHIYKTTVGAIKKDGEISESELEHSAGRKVTDTDNVAVYELQEVILPLIGDNVVYLDNERAW